MLRGQSCRNNRCKRTSCFKMNVDRFKEEFNELRRRFTETDRDKNLLSNFVPLTNQELLEAVHEVLNLKLDVTLVDSTRDDVKTPASGIVVSTPHAPHIPKINVEHNGAMPGRFRSLDTLTSERMMNSPIDDLIIPKLKPLTARNKEKIDVPDVNVEEKKNIPKSNSAISKIVRSDTFVREDEFESMKYDNVFEEKKVDPVASNGIHLTEHSMTEMNVTEILKKLKVLKDVANDMINKIDDVQKGVPEKMCPIRRLSAIGFFPGLNRTLTAGKTTQRTKMTRRSMAAFPDTPTSSRLSPGTAINKDESMRRKSASAHSLVNIGSSKLSIPPANRSISSGAIVIPKKSPINSSSSQGSQCSGIKLPKTPALRSPSMSLSLLNIATKKNPKYAHVQSTIPKPGVTLVKRKAT